MLSQLVSLLALAVATQALYLPIAPPNEARHLAPKAAAVEPRAFHAAHVLPRAGNGGHGVGLRKVRRLKRGRTCKQDPSSGSAFVSATDSTAEVPGLQTKNLAHKTKTDSTSAGASETSASASATSTEYGSASSSASASEGQDSSASASASASSSSQSAATGSGNGTDTGSRSGQSGNSSSSAGSSNDLVPVPGMMLFTTAKGLTGSSTVGSQLNAEAPSSDYDPKTFDDIPVLKMQSGGIAKAPDPTDPSTECQKASYPAGKIGGDSGWWYYSKKDVGNGIDLSKALDVTFSYRVYFPDNFDWTEGGKLPGFYGGTSQDTTHCSGGNHNQDCFSARLMWRKDGAGELYNYFQDAQNPYCSDPNTQCNIGGFGDSVHRGEYSFQKGQWNTVAQRIVLNSVSGSQVNSDGLQELYVNGEKKISLNNIVIRHSADSRVYGLMLSTFFGGGSDKYKPPKDEEAYFKDWTVVVSKEG